MSPLDTLRQLVRPGPGRHRSAPQPERIQVPLDDLLGPPPYFPEPPIHGVLVQAWDDCRPCGRATAGVLHKDGWTCGECLAVTPPADGGAQ
ncbi:hypothetical protein U9R90_25105 [Streptomyces sp. E11-3]|uniref:hypothetical protein n=1 Tax=Streptomyces sp. E11-3 TaxID=3110112 RepID=UPI00397E919C